MRFEREYSIEAARCFEGRRTCRGSASGVSSYAAVGRRLCDWSDCRELSGSYAMLRIAHSKDLCLTRGATSYSAINGQLKTGHFE